MLEIFWPAQKKKKYNSRLSDIVQQGWHIFSKTQNANSENDGNVDPVLHVKFPLKSSYQKATSSYFKSCKNYEKSHKNCVHNSVL